MPRIVLLQMQDLIIIATQESPLQNHRRTPSLFKTSLMHSGARQDAAWWLMSMCLRGYTFYILDRSLDFPLIRMITNRRYERQRRHPRQQRRKSSVEIVTMARMDGSNDESKDAGRVVALPQERRGALRVIIQANESSFRDNSSKTIPPEAPLIVKARAFLCLRQIFS